MENGLNIFPIIAFYWEPLEINFSFFYILKEGNRVWK